MTLRRLAAASGIRLSTMSRRTGPLLQSSCPSALHGTACHAGQNEALTQKVNHQHRNDRDSDPERTRTLGSMFDPSAVSDWLGRAEAAGFGNAAPVSAPPPEAPEL